MRGERPITSYEAQAAGADGAAGDTFTFDGREVALEHGVRPWAGKRNDAPEATTETALDAQAEDVAGMGTRSGEGGGRTEDTSDEVGQEAPAWYSDVVASSHDRDAVQRDDTRVEERLDPLPRDELEWAVEYGLWSARKRLPRKVAPGVFDAYRPAAQAVVEHLERSRIRCFRRAPDPLPRSGSGPAGGSGSGTDQAEADG